MMDFLQYVFSEVKNRRLTKKDGIDLIQQFQNGRFTENSYFLHPLLHQNTSDLSEQRFSSGFTGSEFFLEHHMIKGQRVLPGVAYLEMAREAVTQAAGIPEGSNAQILLKNIAWTRPIAVIDEPVEVHIGLSQEDNGEIVFEVYTSSEDNGEFTIHSQGSVLLEAVGEIPVIDIPSLKTLCSIGQLTSHRCYEAFKILGFDYGPGFRGIESIYIGQGQVLAKLTLDVSVLDTLDRFVIHPGLMDSALQASLGLAISQGHDMPEESPTAAKPSLPFALQELRVFDSCTSSMWAFVRYSKGSKPGDKIQKLDVDLCDENGKVCVQIRGYSSRVLEEGTASHESGEELGTLMLEPYWREKAADLQAVTPEYAEHMVFVVGEDSTLKKEIEGRVKGVRCIPVQHENAAADKWFQECSLQVFGEIKSVLERKHKQRVLVQVVALKMHEQQLITGLSGLLRTAALENTKIVCQMILTEPSEDAGNIAAIIMENAKNPSDIQIRYEAGKRYVMDWRELEAHVGDGHTPWKDNGVYLITGGAGGLGIIFAEEIAHTVKGATLILAGRSPYDNKKEVKIKSLEQLGVRALYKQADVSDREAVFSLIGEINDKFGKLDGIIHSAGITKDNFIIKKSEDEFQKVLAPKVAGTVNLNEASKDIKLDFFILFSSASASLGNPGQSDYAAANGFMDAFASCMNSLGTSHGSCKQMFSIGWPLWKDGGMSVDAETEKTMRLMGIVPMEVSSGIQALYKASAAGRSHINLIHGVTDQIKGQLFPSAEPTTVPRQIGPDTKSLSKLKARIQGFLVQTVTGLLKVGIDDIDVGADLEEYGLDQVKLAELADMLNSEYGLSLTVSVFSECRDINTLTEYLAESCNVQIAKHENEMEPERFPETKETEISETSAVSEDLLREKSVNYLKSQLSSVIKLPADRIEAEAPMEKYGIDSIMSMQLINELEKIFGSLPKTLFFEYQTIKDLTGYFLENYRVKLTELLGLGKKLQVSVEKPKETIIASEPLRLPKAARKRTRKVSPVPVGIRNEKTEGTGDIAIIGLSGRYPKAGNIEEYWENLKNGVDCVTEVPEDRWNHSLYFDSDKGKFGKTYTKWGGFIDGVDRFDPMFFNISPREAEGMDPQERLFLECVYSAVEDAGYTRETLVNNREYTQGGNVGVFVGVMYEEYQLFGAQAAALGVPFALPGNPSSIANRVSYSCNFHGPSMAVDTMCSSSLTAIHLACKSLQRGECKLAVAGGVNLSIHPNKYLLLAQGRFASSKGRCESFGQGGDGYVPGEGVGAVILKPLAKAVEDKDHIYGIIKASTVNHGGKTNGFTVPNPNVQAELIGQAFREAGINPRTVSYIEAHGTGTSLGDPIEIAGLNKAFQEYTDDRQFCAIGSAKSNIGHCESAAGIAGVTKVLMQLKYRQLAPSLHSGTLNPYIDFAGSPFIVQQGLGEWKRPVVEIDGNSCEYPRIAGVSAFGAGGSNAHVIIEEYVPENDSDSSIAVNSENPAVIVLSAKDEERLKNKVQQLLEQIRQDKLSDSWLANAAYTLQVGREAMEERLALLVESVRSLEDKLNSFLNGENTIGGLYKGQTKRNKDALDIWIEDEDLQMAIDTWISKRKYTKLIDLWVKGYSLDWNRLYREDKPRRISMPTYPFAEERYWILKPGEDLSSGFKAAHPASVGSVIHPLLHKNTSSLYRQRFSSIFTGSEPFILERKTVRGKGLPESTVLEMAYRAVNEAVEDLEAGVRITRLESITWNQPMVIGDRHLNLDIHLFPESQSEIAFELCRGLEEENGETVIYSTGLVRLGTDVQIAAVNIKEMREKCSRESFSQVECLKLLEEAGAEPGNIYCSIEEMYLGQNAILAKLCLLEGGISAAGDFILNPFILDSAFQVATLLKTSREGQKPLRLYEIKEIEIHKGCIPTMWAYLRMAEGCNTFDMDLYDGQGAVNIRIKGLELGEYMQQPLGEGVTVAGSVEGADNQNVNSIKQPPEPAEEKTVPLESEIFIPAGKGRRREMKGMRVEECIEWDLKEKVSQILKVSHDKLDRDENLADFGFDSVGLAEYANVLTSHYGIEITPMVFFGHPTIDKLISYFLKEHKDFLKEFYREGVLQKPVSVKEQAAINEIKDSQRRELKKAKFRVERTQGLSEPVAVVGMSGRFPEARNIEEMWKILDGGKDVVGEIPAERFDWRRLKEYVKWDGNWHCGMIPGVSEFDPLFFEISPKEAETMDPRQRLLLQEAWNALEDAGYGASRLKKSRVGMFVGAEDSEYDMLTGGKGGITSNHSAILAARLSYFLNLNGPNMAINTACSSGLVAAHQAVLSLRNYECDMAIAAGVSLTLSPGSYIGMAQAGMLSPDGKCYAFDARANGMVPGEAVAAVVLKRLSQAEADGDPIYAVIKGSGINYDGKTNGITAPSGVSQAELLKLVYNRYRINPEDIDYIVTHGTGTKLGDPIEINALCDAFKEYTNKQGFCALTSNKTNFGHSLAASGLVSLINLVQAMRYEKIPASLNCLEESGYINWKESAFYVNKTGRGWPEQSGKPRTGAVSALGMSGTNAHMVLQSYPQKSFRQAETNPCQLFVFSGKTEEALSERIKTIISYLEEKDYSAEELTRISYTLQEGRHHFRIRCAFVIRDREDALYMLKQAVNKESNPNMFRGKVPKDFKGQEVLLKYAGDLLKESITLKDNINRYEKILCALADLYCQGYEVEWNGLYNRHTPQFVHLPGYPFERGHYWVNEMEKQVGNAITEAPGSGEADGEFFDRLLDEIISDNISIDSAVENVLSANSNKMGFPNTRRR